MIHPLSSRGGRNDAYVVMESVYVPGAGWRGFDPTNNKQAGTEHVSVAVAREQDQAMPLTGAWGGGSDAFERMEISVQVAQTPPVEANHH